MTRRCCVSWLVLVLVALHLATWFEQSERVVSGAVSDREGLVEARTRARARLIGCATAVQDARRRDVARACEALARHPRTPAREAGRLLLEAARSWRAAGDERAQLLCQELVEGAVSDERDRARLELAHRSRRVGDLEEALARYEAVAADAHVEVTLRDRASWWCARTQQLLGDVPAAERAWRRVAQSARDPCLRVRAWDQLGMSCVARGEVTRALSVLAECTRALAPNAAGSLDQGAAVRASMDAMRTRRALVEVMGAECVQDFSCPTID